MSETGFKGKVIALTGGAPGMGYATAKLLASRGALLSVIDVQQDGLEKLKKDIEAAGGKCMIERVDVRDRKQVEAWIQQTVSAFGRLDGCANIAGAIGKQIFIDDIENIEDDDWNFVLGVNLTGLMNCMRAQIPHINTPGSIVNCASTSGLRGHPKNGAYCAAKHGVIGLSRAAAKELGPKGIRVNCFAPGPINTPMLALSEEIIGTKHNFDALGLRLTGEPSEIAEAVAWLLCEKSSFITGTVHTVDGGWIN